jgi:hypothetical protein
MNKFWRYGGVSVALLLLGGAVGAHADPMKPMAPPPVQAGPVLANPPTIKLTKVPLASAGKLALLHNALHLPVTQQITPQNLDTPVELSARTPWLNNGTFTISATLMTQFYPNGSDGPYLDVLPYGAVGTNHPNMTVSFVVYPDRGALIDCAGGGAGPWQSQLAVEGASVVIETFNTFTDGHVTAVLQKSPDQRNATFAIRSIPGGGSFAISTCEVTPIRY